MKTSVETATTNTKNGLQIHSCVCFNIYIQRMLRADSQKSDIVLR